MKKEQKIFYLCVLSIFVCVTQLNASFKQNEDEEYQKRKPNSEDVTLYDLHLSKYPDDSDVFSLETQELEEKNQFNTRCKDTILCKICLYAIKPRCHSCHLFLSLFCMALCMKLPEVYCCLCNKIASNSDHDKDD